MRTGSGRGGGLKGLSADHSKYLAIGEPDRMTLRFVKGT
jgi:hypothetical protein